MVGNRSAKLTPLVEVSPTAVAAMKNVVADVVSVVANGLKK